jgi:hypothetical protein
MNNSDQGEWLNQGSISQKEILASERGDAAAGSPALRKDLDLFDAVAIVVGTIMDLLRTGGWGGLGAAAHWARIEATLLCPGISVAFRTVLRCGNGLDTQHID